MLDGYQEIHVQRAKDGLLMVMIRGVSGSKIWSKTTTVKDKSDIPSFAADVAKSLKSE